MPKGSPELTNARREEIINACEKLYRTMSFKEITIKEIGAVTSFTRTSIYNYFQTKEEIFLALIEREYNLWCDDLEITMRNTESMTKDEFAAALARSLELRPQLLKLLSMNHYDMEENSRLDRLTDMKVAYDRSMRTVREFLKKYFPQLSEQRIHEFIYLFFPFMFGIYPYAVVTDKQWRAMKDAGMDYPEMTIYDLTYGCVKRLLENIV